MIKTMLLLLLAGVLATGQEATAAKPAEASWQSKIISVKHLTGGKGNSLAGTLRQFLQPNGTAYYDTMMDLFLVKGTPEAVANAEKLIARFDVPEPGQTNRQVQYTIYLLEASADSTRGQPVPAALEPVIQQMRTTFPFKVYRLVDTITLTGRTNGGIDTSGILPASMSIKDQPVTYQMKCGKAVIGEDPKTINMSDFRFGLRVPYIIGNGGLQFADTGINTDLSVREGQKLVIGKLSAGLSENAIFLVLTAKID